MLIFSGVHYYLLEPSTLSRSRTVSLDWFLTCPLEDWVCTAFYTHLQFRGRVSDAQGSRTLPSILSPALSTQPSLVIQNSIVSNKPARYIDSRMVDELRELGF
jgi:hypothetical protein